MAAVKNNSKAVEQELINHSHIAGWVCTSRSLADALDIELRQVSSILSKLFLADSEKQLVPGMQLIRVKRDAGQDGSSNRSASYSYHFEVKALVSSEEAAVSVKAPIDNAPRRVPKAVQAAEPDVQQPASTGNADIDAAIDSVADVIVQRVKDSVERKLGEQMDGLVETVGERMAKAIEERVIRSLKTVRNRIVYPTESSVARAAVDAGSGKSVARQNAERLFASFPMPSAANVQATKAPVAPVKVELPSGASVITVKHIQVSEVVEKQFAKFEPATPAKVVKPVEEKQYVKFGHGEPVPEIAKHEVVKKPQVPVQKLHSVLKPKFVIFGLQAVQERTVTMKLGHAIAFNFVPSARNESKAIQVARSGDAIFVMERATSSAIRKAVKDLPNFNLINGSVSQLLAKLHQVFNDKFATEKLQYP